MSISPQARDFIITPQLFTPSEEREEYLDEDKDGQSYHDLARAIAVAKSSEPRYTIVNLAELRALDREAGASQTTTNTLAKIKTEQLAPGDSVRESIQDMADTISLELGKIKAAIEQIILKAQIYTPRTEPAAKPVFGLHRRNTRRPQRRNTEPVPTIDTEPPATHSTHPDTAGARVDDNTSAGHVSD
ncbi:uncharacterized protein TRAVEDRAFT_48158 [Trametes versicolor FP-101664 SS1]|uniref:uncharacterized protein n=1 Tax=Trametes versicolor (strain FP-101664) TaxID=717944 RepID=UPI0004624160|nr:uncharacterized protein TRAVEDRAFT_48158 [Trametes versicolor FP-101664 SS1]EIW59031.1 hypothetical protein TRAVEDRAFT_48158 [Trametes versicolor FP-101664 SS1]